MRVVVGSNEGALDEYTMESISSIEHDSLLLPHCPICIRRVQQQIALLPLSTRMPVFPDFKGNESMCYVCRVFSDQTHEVNIIYFDAIL